MKKTLLLTLIAGMSLSAFAQTFTYEGVKYDVLDASAKTAQTAAGNSYASPGNNLGAVDLVIPETVVYNGDNYTVTAVGDNSFSDYNYTNGLKSIDLPATITRIGYSGFLYISSLKEMTIRATTPPEVYNNSFQYVTKCPLYVPAGSVDAYADVFAGWTIVALGEVALNPNFEYNGILYSITDMDAKTVETRQDVGVTIGADGSYSSGNVANNDVGGEVVIPETLVYEGETYTVTSIGYGSFFGSSITSVKLPSSVIEIGDYAFAYNMNIASIDFPKAGLEVIGDDAFFYNESLKSVVLPETVYYIGQECFEWCDAMTSFVLPAGVSNILQGTFNGCTELVSFTSYATVPPSLEVADLLVFSEVTKDVCTLYVPKGSEAAYAEGADSYQWGYYFSDIKAIDNAGVDSIEIDFNAPVEYYNLQGVRVNNPEAGQIVIMRQGNTVKKVMK